MNCIQVIAWSICEVMADKSVDTVITDPPYNVGINYGVANDNLSDSDYRKLIETHISEYNRIANGIVLILEVRILKHGGILT